MSHGQLTRREFLIIGGTVAAGTLAVGPAAGVAAARPPGRAAGIVGQPQIIYRLSLRGRRGSRAAKEHAANFRFATIEAAQRHRAHPGDNSRVVAIVISADEYDRLFTSRGSEVADLRHLRGPVHVGDCNRNGRVTVDELVRGVGIALGVSPVTECTPFDRVPDGRVTVDELVRGVRNALG